MIFIFVTDRTQEDIDRLLILHAIGWKNMTDEERAEWQSSMKGAYNYTDLNRVESAVKRLAEEIGISLVTKTDWNESDTPTQKDMQRYLENVASIRRFCPISSVYPLPTSTMDDFDYVKANDIETNLKQCDETLKAVSRCGEIYSGEW